MEKSLKAEGVGGRGRSADYGAVVPHIFIEPGVSGEEYAQLEKRVESVKVDRLRDGVLKRKRQANSFKLSVIRFAFAAWFKAKAI